MLENHSYNEPYTVREFTIPMRMMSIIEMYIENGIIPGHFLQAIICNDLHKALAHADSENLRNIPAYPMFFYNQTPGLCWGSKEKMLAWSEQGGYLKIKRKEPVSEPVVPSEVFEVPTAAIVNKISEHTFYCDSDELCSIARACFGGKWKYIGNDHLEYTKDDNYGGAFDTCNNNMG